MSTNKSWLIAVMDTHGREIGRRVFETPDTNDGAEEAFATYDEYEGLGYRPFLFGLAKRGEFTGYWIPCLTSDGPWPEFAEVVA